MSHTCSSLCTIGGTQQKNTYGSHDVCLCNNIGLVALILLGWELRASSITVLCVYTSRHDLVSFLCHCMLFMPSLYSRSNSKNFYITCIRCTRNLALYCAPLISDIVNYNIESLFLIQPGIRRASDGTKPEDY